MSWTRLGALINFVVSIICTWQIIKTGDVMPALMGYPVGLLLARSFETLVIKHEIPPPSA